MRGRGGVSRAVVGAPGAAARCERPLRAGGPRLQPKLLQRCAPCSSTQDDENTRPGPHPDVAARPMRRRRLRTRVAVQEWQPASLSECAPSRARNFYGLRPLLRRDSPETHCASLGTLLLLQSSRVPRDSSLLPPRSALGGVPAPLARQPSAPAASDERRNNPQRPPTCARIVLKNRGYTTEPPRPAPTPSIFRAHPFGR